MSKKLLEIVAGQIGQTSEEFYSESEVDSLVAGLLSLQGAWDASTNTPDITGTTTTGYAWRVSVAGSTNLGGITSWSVGDLAVKTATGWLKIANSDVAAVWGNISGTLADQTDLQNYLNKVKTKIITLNILGGTSLIAVGSKGYICVPFTGTIVGWRIAEISPTPIAGSIVVDVWKDTTANYPPTVADTIAGSEKPTLSSAKTNSDLTLTTWTTAVTAGDFIGINVDSITDCKNVQIEILMEVA